MIELYKKLTWYLGRNQFDGTTAVNGIKTPSGFDKDRRQMCSFTFKDEMFLIGGGNNMYLKVHEDRIEELDQLSFSFIDGRCTPVGDKFVMACAGDRTERACYKFEANGAYSKATSTREVHSAGAMSVFESRSDADTAVIVAGRNNQQGSMEVFNERTGLWNVESTSVFMQYRAHFSIVRSRDQLMAFGGCIAEGGVCSSESTDVYYMKQSTMLWAKFPQSLKSPRSNHVTLADGDLIVHIGGSSDKARKFESWRNSKADPGQYDIDESKTTLKNWSSYPYAFFVNYNTYNK